MRNTFLVLIYQGDLSLFCTVVTEKRVHRLHEHTAIKEKFSTFNLLIIYFFRGSKDVFSLKVKPCILNS